MAVSVAMKGTNEVAKAFAEIAELGTSDEAYDATQQAAAVIWKSIRDRAPTGPTGNLRDSVIMFKLPKRGGQQPGSVVRIRWKTGRGPVGRHFYWIEYGTALMRHPKTRKALRFVIDGEEFYRKEVGPIPAKPFFRPGLDAAKDHALRTLEREALDMIERHFAKG